MFAVHSLVEQILPSLTSFLTDVEGVARLLLRRIVMQSLFCFVLRCRASHSGLLSLSMPRG